MSEKILSEVIINSGFKAEWFNKNKTSAKIDYTSGKACYVPIPFFQRNGYTYDIASMPSPGTLYHPNPGEELR